MRNRKIAGKLYCYRGVSQRTSKRRACVPLQAYPRPFSERSLFLLPAPGVAAHVVYTETGFPAEQLFCQCRVRITGSDVARTPRHNRIRNSTTAGFLERAHHLQYRIAAPGAEIDGQQTLVLKQVFECGEMASTRVNDMDVIAHARAVGRRIVAAICHGPQILISADLLRGGVPPVTFVGG